MTLRKLLVCLLASLLLTVIIGTGAYASVCVYGSRDYPGSNGCSDEDCGHGCDPPYSTTTHNVCMPNAAGCCWCTWTTTKCHCLLGDGTGVQDASQHSWSNGTCNDTGDSCATVTIQPS